MCGVSSEGGQQRLKGTKQYRKTLGDQGREEGKRKKGKVAG
jgi:hypothetical protein